MPEDLMETLATLDASDASVAELFGDAGASFRARAESPEFKRRLFEAARFLHDVKTGRRRMYHLKEALSTSDFPQLFGAILDRQLLGMYQEAPATWRSYCRRSTVQDFRTVSRFRLDGAEAVLEDVGELAEYPEAQVTDDEYQYRVTKKGKRIGLSWESMVNDDLDAFSSLPERLARSARRSEEKFATGLFVDVNGPHASFFTTANKNRVHSENGAGIPNNPPLTIAGLQHAMTVLAAQRDNDGEPIAIDAVTLVVPPALRVTAQNIMNATTIDVNDTLGGGTQASGSGQRLRAVNWMSSMVTLAVNYYIPVVASTANGATTWFLFASPTDGRPALELGFLRGHESPEIFERIPDARRVGGSEDMVNFATDSKDWKVRHVFGGTRLDPRAGVSSSGSGS